MNKNVLRGVAVLLFGLSCTQGFCELWLGRASRLAAQEKIDAALVLMNQTAWARSWLPEWHRLRGELLRKQFEVIRSPAMIESAAEEFKAVSQMAPRSSKAWLYRALTEIQRGSLKNTVTGIDWDAVKKMMEQAVTLEPGSAWIQFQAATALLAHSEQLSKNEQDQQVGQLRQSLNLHYPFQISPYLEPAYDFLWRVYHQPQMLAQVTPFDRASYEKLIRFFETHLLWDSYAQCFQRAVALRNADYNALCGMGDQFLLKSDRIHARKAYDEALRLEPALWRAKAGVLASLEEGEHLEQRNGWLSGMLVQDSEKLEFYLKRMDENHFVIPRTLDGLFAFRRGDGTVAVARLEETRKLSELIRRRFLLRSYLQKGDQQKAASLWRPLLKDDAVDLRDLSLGRSLHDVLTKDEAAALENTILKNTTGHKSAENWWSETAKGSHRLDHKTLTGMALNLKPGRVRITVLMKGVLDGSHTAPVVLARLWEDSAMTFLTPAAAAVGAQWQKYSFEVDSVGGWRWFQLEFLNGAEAGHSGPILLLGTVNVESLS